MGLAALTCLQHCDEVAINSQRYGAPAAVDRHKWRRAALVQMNIRTQGLSRVQGPGEAMEQAV